MNITIDEEVRAMVPGVALGVLFYEADVAPSGGEALEAFEAQCAELAQALTTGDIAELAHNAASRIAYRALGKDPGKYRPAAEAMLRRVVKGKGLYHINNVVDVNNLISITSGYSIGSYVTEKVEGDVVLVRADDDAYYPGIGKDDVHISHLPVLKDAAGYFGNPTSDSQRTMVTEGRHTVMSVVYAFDGTEGLGECLQRYADALWCYCGVNKAEAAIIQ